MEKVGIVGPVLNAKDEQEIFIDERRAIALKITIVFKYFHVQASSTNRGIRMKNRVLFFLVLTFLMVDHAFATDLIAENPDLWAFETDSTTQNFEQAPTDTLPPVFMGEYYSTVRNWYPTANELKIVQKQKLDERIPPALAELGYTTTVGNFVFTAPTTYKTTYINAQEFCSSHDAQIPTQQEFETLISHKRENGTIIRSKSHPDNHVVEAWTSTSQDPGHYMAYDREHHTFRPLEENKKLEIICVVTLAN